MKKTTALISALALLLSLCACSGQAENMESESASPEPEISAQPVSEEPTHDTEPGEEPSNDPAKETEAPEPSDDAQPSDAAPGTPSPTPAPASEPTPAADPKTVAIELSARRAPVSELYAAIGQPISSDYAPGCMEPNSEDGELIYSGFTVYTVRTATQEYIFDVQ